MSDELKAAHKHIAELERELEFMREQSRVKDFVIGNLSAQLRGETVPSELPAYVKCMTPPPSDQVKGGEA